MRLGELERLNLKINRASLTEGTVPTVLGLPPCRLSNKVPHEVVLVGNPFQTTANAQLRLDGSPSRRRHPELLQDANRQRHRRRAEQQSEARHPQFIRIQHRQDLDPKSLPLNGSPSATPNRAYIRVTRPRRYCVMTRVTPVLLWRSCTNVNALSSINLSG